MVVHVWLRRIVDAELSCNHYGRANNKADRKRLETKDIQNGAAPLETNNMLNSKGSLKMGAWGDIDFENDTVLDFMHSLDSDGLKRLRLGLCERLEIGLERVATVLTPLQIEAKLLEKLVQHRVYIAEGRNVGSEEELEEKWRRTLRNEQSRRYLWEVFEVACAVSVVLAALDPENIAVVPAEMSAWIRERKASIAKDAKSFLDCSRKGLALIFENAETVKETLQATIVQDFSGRNATVNLDRWLLRRQEQQRRIAFCISELGV